MGYRMYFRVMPMLVSYVKNAWEVNLVCELCSRSTVAVRSIINHYVSLCIVKVVCVYMEGDLYISVYIFSRVLISAISANESKIAKISTRR